MIGVVLSAAFLYGVFTVCQKLGWVATPPKSQATIDIEARIARWREEDRAKRDAE